MKMILSTLTAPQDVVITKKTESGALEIVKTITIKGGANVIDRRTLATPQGVVTELSDADFDQLKKTAFYQRMESRGYLRPVEAKETAEDTKKAGMEKKDKSAQKTEEDFPDEEAKPVSSKGRKKRNG
jgi:hypothetical protein